jgi:hypothetical protein
MRIQLAIIHHLSQICWNWAKRLGGVRAEARAPGALSADGFISDSGSTVICGLEPDVEATAWTDSDMVRTAPDLYSSPSNYHAPFVLRVTNM